MGTKKKVSATDRPEEKDREQEDLAHLMEQEEEARTWMHQACKDHRDRAHIGVLGSGRQIPLEVLDGGQLVQRRAETMRIDMSDEQRLEAGRTVATHHAALARLDALKKTVTGELKASVEAYEATIDKLLPAVKSGHMWSEVETVRVIRGARSVTYRCDTWEVVADVEASPEERQMNL